jgi:hypothetical protein
MGEIADDMIEGAICSRCGIYFQEEHGYPVVCKQCWKHATKQERKHLQQATSPELG